MNFRARDKVLALERRVAVMGVVNVTPDSFYAGSRHPDPGDAVEAALGLVEEGADIVDIGGESTRPGATSVAVDEELDRIVPVIERLRPRTGAILSIDTRKAAVARRAIQAGADLVNDVSALGDAAMGDVVASEGAGLVLMHMQGSPETMQRDPSYDDVVVEIRDFLARVVAKAESAGVPSEAILVDPGIGFGKTLEHNLSLLNRLDVLGELGKPVVVGTSRKGFIAKLLDEAPEGRIFGTAASVACSVLRGAHVVRVHDVAEMLDVVRVAEAIRRESGVSS